MIFVLDNYDSFTYNLVQMLGELGATLEVRRNDQVTVAQVESLRPQALVLSPGPGRPEDAGILVECIRHFEGKIPMLGVCLGHQAMGLVFGGRVIAAPTLVHGKATSVKHDGRTIFRDAPNPLDVGRYHSLIVETSSLPKTLEVSAATSDGIIMAMRHRSLPIEGVQFHPESILTPAGGALLRNFLTLAG